jgi:hypothetical protein
MEAGELAVTERKGEAAGGFAHAHGGGAAVLDFLVLQTFLWVSSTLSRMVCKEDVRWKAWSCTGDCLG